MTTWFPKGMPILSGDELTQARDLRKKECRFSIHEATEILLDQCGKSLPLALAAWTGEITFLFEGERDLLAYSHSSDSLPKESAVLKHIEVKGDELNRWLQDKHPWVGYRFPIPAGQPATVAPASETKDERQDRRLQDCEAAGLVMPKSSAGRLPKGIGIVAEREGLTRQAFSSDVKAALKRRESKKKEGSTIHLA